MTVFVVLFHLLTACPINNKASDKFPTVLYYVPLFSILGQRVQCSAASKSNGSSHLSEPLMNNSILVGAVNHRGRRD